MLVIHFGIIFEAISIATNDTNEVIDKIYPIWVKRYSYGGLTGTEIRIPKYETDTVIVHYDWVIYMRYFFLCSSLYKLFVKKRSVFLWQRSRPFFVHCNKNANTEINRLPQDTGQDLIFNGVLCSSFCNAI